MPKTFSAILGDLKYFQEMGEEGTIDSTNMARFLNALTAASTKMKEEDATEANTETIRAAYKILLTQSKRYDEKFLGKVNHVIDIIEGAFKIYDDGKKEAAAHRLPRVRARVAVRAIHERNARRRLLNNRKTLRKLHRATHGLPANNSNSNSSSSHSSGSSGSSGHRRSSSHSRSRSRSGASRKRTVTPKTSGNNE